MNSKEIRQNFLDFFKSKHHRIVKSAPMVIKNDPTLMFTNAGMNQFKDVFLGNITPESGRVVNSQKCLRVSGKHNDLEEVGVDTYHHTMFEMLGNWSFGDYFKQEAIAWAWEFLTKELGIDEKDLYVTYFGGDKADGLEADTEAYELWKGIVPEERIIAASKKDNFWEMGETGPCGPCSEIHIDIRKQAEREKTPGRELVNQDHPHVIEIWNLVFMEYNRLEDGSLQPLPNKHVDTGMGFERLCMVLQNKQSNYDTDVFSDYIKTLEQLSSISYKAGDDKQSVAFRVISDHIRAIAFSIADGQLPSNTGAGYVIRRILRRAVRYGYSFLEFDEPFMYKLIPDLIRKMGDYFEELGKQEELITNVIREEEVSFLKTLEKGILRISEYTSNHDRISGEFAFELYDTFGFPIDLTELIAQEKNMDVDLKGFEAHLNEQKDRSRKATKLTTGDWTEIHDSSQSFIGYDETTSTCRIIKYRQVQKGDKSFYQLVIDTCPFYPEGGGQVGDSGALIGEEEKIEVLDTKKENNLIVLFTNELPKNPNSEFKAQVNTDERYASAKNHTATHLLHHALRTVLGDHVQQKGSLVHPDYLRFDFSHFNKVSQEELNKIEAFVNAEVVRNRMLNEKREIPIAEAENAGALMLFGEKYGDKVRMIQFGDSKELCGGTHVSSTAEIGLFKITQESSVASGVRRIEALTSTTALDYLNRELEALEEIRKTLKRKDNLVAAIQQLQQENQSLKKEMEKANKGKAADMKGELLDKTEEVNGIRLIAEKTDLDSKAIKDIAFELKNKEKNLIMLLGSNAGGKTTLNLMVTDDLVKEKNLKAGALIRDLAQCIQGGGGGQPFFATAGGKNPEGIPDAIEKMKTILENWEN